eukprot:scaffold52103_cov20-Prasinocladus_malaysianus.AAC.1
MRLYFTTAADAAAASQIRIRLLIYRVVAYCLSIGAESGTVSCYKGACPPPTYSSILLAGDYNHITELSFERHGDGLMQSLINIGLTSGSDDMFDGRRDGLYHIAADVTTIIALHSLSLSAKDEVHFLPCLPVCRSDEPVFQYQSKGSQKNLTAFAVMIKNRIELLLLWQTSYLLATIGRHMIS